MGEDERAPGVTGGQVGRVLTPWESSVGGIPLARILPCRERVSIGPFVELERVGPLYMEPGIGLQMGPIPRVGVATITYPIQGEVIHRDSLGTEQLLTPGDLNLVVAGSGLTASERSPQDVLEAGGVLDGLRMTLLLEEQDSDCDPRFVRYPADDLVSTEGEGWFARVLIGTGLGVTSPCQFAGAFLADVTLAAGARLDFEADFAERGALAAERDACIEGVDLPEGSLAVIQGGESLALSADQGARVLLFGGPPVARRKFVQRGIAATDRHSHAALVDLFRRGAFSSIDHDPGPPTPP